VPVLNIAPDNWEDGLDIKDKEEVQSTWTLVKRILEIVIPSFFSLLLGDVVWQITVIYAGRTGDAHSLAAIGMVSNINMLIPVSLTFGTSRALSTLVS
jgi:Na+-driven multidrug efflux pump